MRVRRVFTLSGSGAQHMLGGVRDSLWLHQ